MSSQTTTPTASGSGAQERTALLSVFEPPSNLRKQSNQQSNAANYRSVAGHHVVTPESVQKPQPKPKEQDEPQKSWVSDCKACFQSILKSSVFHPPTIAGALMFLLYHIVFCLAMGSAIQRPSSSQPILGVMAKMSAVGIIFSGPLYIFRLGSDVPCLYPSIDLFMAPFLAKAAAVVDASLVQQYAAIGQSAPTYPDAQFFATFAVLSAIGMLWSGLLLQLAAKFKLANLGTFLPYSVLCGFFSAVGVLLWALAFSVDTNGHTWEAVFFQSDDKQLMLNSLIHHLPSLFLGITMNKLGPKSPFSVMLLILAAQITCYAIMWGTGTSLKEAQEAGWFWSQDELVYEKDVPIGFESWTAPPAPFGCILVIFHPKSVNWTAVWTGLHQMASLAVLYLLRSSIHASALKKNISNLVRRVPLDNNSNSNNNNNNSSNVEALTQRTLNVDDTSSASITVDDAPSMVASIRTSYHQVSLSLSDDQAFLSQVMAPSPPKASTFRPRAHSDNGGELDAELLEGQNSKVDTAINTTADGKQFMEIRAKPPQGSLENIFVEYGYCLCVAAVAGGFGCCPTVATSKTLFAIGADTAAPQYGSILLLALFYLTNFELVQYLPKAAFSSLLVLGAVDTFDVWWIQSFQKSQDLWEWSVVPIIVAFSLVVGFLQAVFLGVAISTFVFVGAFFKVGSVKFAATALQVRSSIERPIPSSTWLDCNGDFIQVLVLQNYLFFGNANSIFSYVATMFEDVGGERLGFDAPPKPKVLVVDLSLISGMDTSTIDVFAEIKQLCTGNECKLYVCGMSSRARKGFALAGLKPDLSVDRSQRSLRFFSDLDTALGKAEDFVLKSGSNIDEYASPRNRQGSALSDLQEAGGFRYALLQIDEQHDENFAEGLFELEDYTTPVELHPGDALIEDEVTYPTSGDSKRGLFFVESGLLKLEKNTTDTMTRSRGHLSISNNTSRVTQNTLKNLHARMGTLGRQTAAARSSVQLGQAQNFRVARMGPGWVCGANEMTVGTSTSTPHRTIAVSACRLHYLPRESIEKLETENPGLVLKLYKMLSHLMARHHEVTIQQLATMHSIMSSPAHSKPISRSTLNAMSRG